MKLKLLLPAAAAIATLAAFTFYKTAPAAYTCNACDSLTGLEKIVCLADEFKATLTSTQLAACQLDYTLANAKKWSNLPVGAASRVGVRFDALSTDQLIKAKAIIQLAMGTGAGEGYDEAKQTWAADKFLSQNGGGNGYGDGLYFLAFLGTPSTTGAWELQTGGHHIAVANNYSGGSLVGATPSFRGVEPFAAFTIDGVTNQPLIQERDSLAAMLASLSTTELATAKLSGSFNDIVLGPGKDWSFPTTKSGLKCSGLTAAQKAKVLAAIKTYVADIDDADAATIMATYTAQIDDTYIAYVGTSGLATKNDYVRIDGPRVWIEFSMQGGIILSPNHPHSVWRDHTTDYGGLGGPTATGSAQRFEGKFEVYPNPASASVEVEIELKEAALVSVSLFDAAGRKLSTGLRYNMTAGSHALPLDISAAPTGSLNCLLEVKKADGTTAIATRKLVKI